MLLGTLSLIVVKKRKFKTKQTDNICLLKKRPNKYKRASSKSVLSLKGPDLQYRAETEIFVV